MKNINNKKMEELTLLWGKLHKGIEIKFPRGNYRPIKFLWSMKYGLCANIGYNGIAGNGFDKNCKIFYPIKFEKVDEFNLNFEVVYDGSRDNLESNDYKNYPYLMEDFTEELKNDY